MLLNLEWQSPRGVVGVDVRRGGGEMSSEGADCTRVSGSVSSWHNQDHTPFPTSLNNSGKLSVSSHSLSLDGFNLKLRQGEYNGKWRALLWFGGLGKLSGGWWSARPLVGSALFFKPGCKAAQGVAPDEA